MTVRAREARVRPVRTWPRRILRRVPEALGLSLALLFVFMMGLLPHTDTFGDPAPGGHKGLVGLTTASWEYATGEREGYPYTVHVDENAHWVASAQMQRQDRVLTDDPYTGTKRDTSEPFSLRGAVHEVGFRLILAEMQELTGVPWVRLFHFLPALWMSFTAFAMYAMLRPHPAAIPAAALVGLIPTTVRFLGPAFLVPIGFVLAWLPVTMILADAARLRARSAFLLSFVVAWSFFVHLIGGFAAVLVLATYALARVAKERRSVLALVLIAVAPLTWLANAFGSDVSAEAGREEILPIDFSIFREFGLVALFAWAVGVVLFQVAPTSVRQREMSAFVAAGFMVLVMIVLSVALDLNRYATYARWHPPFFLMACVPIGFLVGWAARQVGRLVDPSEREAPAARLAAGVRVGAAAIVVALLLAPGATAHQEAPYYRVAEHEEWRRMEAAATTLVPDGGRFLSDPWQAPIFLAMTGWRPHTWLSPGTAPINGDDYYVGHLLEARSLEFYLFNDITLIFDSQAPPEAYESRGQNVWILAPPLAKQLIERPRQH